MLATSDRQWIDIAGSAIASEPISPAANPAAAASPGIFQFSIQSGCAAALLCVEEQYCTLEGVISPEPVALTSKQLLRRVPLSVSNVECSIQPSRLQNQDRFFLEVIIFPAISFVQVMLCNHSILQKYITKIRRVFLSFPSKEIVIIFFVNFLIFY